MSCLKAEKSPWFSWKLNFTVLRQVAWKLWRDSIMQLRWLCIEGTCHKHSTVPAFQLHGTKGLQGLQHILHALPWVSPLWLPPSHLETEVAFVGAKQDSPVLSLLWSQPGNRWGPWVHELSSHYPGSVGSCRAVSIPALLCSPQPMAGWGCSLLPKTPILLQETNMQSAHQECSDGNPSNAQNLTWGLCCDSGAQSLPLMIVQDATG